MARFYLAMETSHPHPVAVTVFSLTDVVPMLDALRDVALATDDIRDGIRYLVHILSQTEESKRHRLISSATSHLGEDFNPFIAPTMCFAVGEICAKRDLHAQDSMVMALIRGLVQSLFLRNEHMKQEQYRSESEAIRSSTSRN